MNVSLTPKLEALVRRKVASGLYNNASEVVREALRLLAERERPAPRPEARRTAATTELPTQLAALAPELRRRGLTSLALFGSSVRGEDRPDSDIDLLIEVDSKARFSLVDLVSVKNLLEERLGRPVDVVTREGLDPAVLTHVLREMEPIF